MDSLIQQTFADVAPPREKVDWSTYARSCSDNEKQIIRWIMDLHNGGRPFDLDPTYSRGVFWYDLPKPRYRFDLHPQARGVVQADATRLPVANESIGSIMFDPPFVVGSRADGRPGEIKERFSYFRSVPELFIFYELAMREFYRVLNPFGILAFKCQDMIDSGHQIFSHVFIHNTAELVGFYIKDMFVLSRENVLWSPNMVNQQHARKNHSYFLVLVKQ